MIYIDCATRMNILSYWHGTYIIVGGRENYSPWMIGDDLVVRMELCWEMVVCRSLLAVKSILQALVDVFGCMYCVLG